MSDQPRMAPFDFQLIVQGRVTGQSREVVQALLARDFHIPLGYINAVTGYEITVQPVSSIIGPEGIDPRALRSR